jgi:shikimate dehydrogenase
LIFREEKQIKSLNTYLKNPKQVIILGYPLEHTFSPVLHNFAFQYLNLDYIYTAFPVEPAKIQELGNNFLRILPFAGGNVTIPFKEKIFNCLDKFTEAASQIGAVNTFYKKDGLLWGDNTDMYGFLQSVRGLENNFNGKKVLLLGTGGSAKAVTTALTYLKVKEIVIVSRSLENAVIFAANREQAFSEIKWSGLDYRGLQSSDKSNDFSVIINTTPTGMYDNLSPLSEPFLAGLDQDTIIYDLIYNPAMTKLLLMAQERGLHTINGTEMLVNQAARAFYLWTGKDFPLDEAKKVLKDLSFK